MIRRPEDTGPKERLQNISRHFLDEGHSPRCIAVLGVAENPHAIPIDGLARALAGRGIAVAVTDTAAKLLVHVCQESGGIRPATDVAPLSRGREDTLARPRRGAHPELTLITTPPTDARTCSLILLAVPAQAHGMRSAYRRLKGLARLNPMPAIGITLTDARTCDEATAGFARFASAARHFLGIGVASYSYLAAGRTHGEDEASLNDIARLLLADLRRADQTDQPTKPPDQEAPWVCG